MTALTLSLFASLRPAAARHPGSKQSDTEQRRNPSFASLGGEEAGCRQAGCRCWEGCRQAGRRCRKEEVSVWRGAFGRGEGEALLRRLPATQKRACTGELAGDGLSVRARGACSSIICGAAAARRLGAARRRGEARLPHCTQQNGAGAAAASRGLSSASSFRRAA